MSTILKALRRLEEEKATQPQGRPLREEVTGLPPRSPSPGRRPWAVLGGAIVLGLATGGAGLWWAGSDGDGTESGTPGPVASAPTAVAVPKGVEPTRKAPAATPSGGPPEVAFASEVEVVTRPERQPRIADARPVERKLKSDLGTRRPVEDSTAAARAREAALAQMAAVRSAAEPAGAEIQLADAGTPTAATPERPAAEPTPAPRTTARAATPEPKVATPPKAAPAPAPQPTRAKAAPPKPEPESKPTPAPAPRAAPAPSPKPAPSAEVAAVAAPPAPAPATESAVPAPAPPVTESPAPPAQTGPELSVEKTRWHPLPERRSAWLLVAGEGTRVVEGDVVAGMVVAEIEPSGVVLERDGEKTRKTIAE